MNYNKYKYIVFIFLLFVSTAFPLSAFAIIFDSNTYFYGYQKIYVSEGSGGPIHVFDLSNPSSQLFSQESYSSGDEIRLYLGGGEYVVVETADSNCSTYTDCKAEGEFVGEYNFSVSSGITINKSRYGETEEMVITSQGPSGGNAFQIYSFLTDSFLWGNSSYSLGDVISIGLSVGNYSILEALDYNCFYLTYLSCKSDSSFLKEVLFTVVPSDQASSGGDLEAPVQARIPSYPPKIEIKSPFLGGVFSKKIPISYSAIDDNDILGGMSKSMYGLVEKPISIFYTDKFTRDYEISENDINKVLIAKDLSNTSNYIWNASDLLEQKFYQVIVRAVDRVGMIRYAVSGLFGVDYTAPTFIVNASPSVVKKEKVTINITSSEDLSKAPVVSVVQRGSTPHELKVTGEKNNFKAIYEPVDGFDGTAVIKVSGTDMASNTGDVITIGGNFNVGINPPIKPVIISPLNNEKVNSETIDISGVTREDTTVTAIVNGIEKYNAKPNEKGEFIIKNVLLKKKSINGKNIISIVSIDQSGSISEGVVLNTLFNFAPKISISQPTDRTLLTGMTTIAVNYSDENDDKLRFNYEISKFENKIEDLKWITIEDVPSEKINFNTTKFTDGAYLLRVTADDGVSTSASGTVSINIKNDTSFFIRFYDGLRIFTKEKKATVRGIVFAGKNKTTPATIKSLYYSTNGGVKWVKVEALDGSFDSSEERFVTTITSLKDGLNNVLWQSKDSRGVIVNSDEPIIVDSIAPVSPEILSPKSGAILSKNENDLTEKNKFNFTVHGKSEPDSIVSLEIDGKKYKAQASYDGVFKIRGISLSKIGKYKMKIVATDEALNQSRVIEQSLIYDNPPTIVFTAPRTGSGVGANTNISWIMNDIDGDILKNKILSYRQIGSPFVVLSKDFKNNEFNWTTKNLSGNDFEIKLEASDGLIKTSEIVPFSIDHNVPRLLSFDLVKSALVTGNIFEAKGEAVDADSGVEFVEYSFIPFDKINNTTNQVWYKASVDKKSKQTSFRIKNKIKLKDGEYSVAARALDKAHNISENKYLKFVVDTTPPRVGSIEVESGGSKILPVGDAWNLVGGVGVSIKVSFEKDTQYVYMMNEEKRIDLVRDQATGLWTGKFTPNKIGPSQISVFASDMTGNILRDKPLMNLQVKSKGKIVYLNSNNRELPVSGAKVNAYLAEKGRSFWSIFKTKNIVSSLSDENGEFAMVLPEGDYRVSVSKEGFDTLDLGVFSNPSPSFFVNNVSLSKHDKSSGLWSKFINVVKLN